MKITRTIIFFLFLSYGFLFSQNKVQKATENFVQNLDLKNAAISICVVDLDMNENVSFHNKNMGIQSASTAKLFSTSSALKILGPNYRASTKFYTSDTIIDNTLQGNLIIEGGGDPSFGSRYFNHKDSLKTIFYKIIDSLYNIGIHKIMGDIVIDGSKFSYQGAPDD